MNQKFKFDNPFWISDYTIYDSRIVFRLCTKQGVGGKSQEGKQLKFPPQLDKFV